jgi:hypothetical protein
VGLQSVVEALLDSTHLGNNRTWVLLSRFQIEGLKNEVDLYDEYDDYEVDVVDS